jgi:hypothetical protein
MPQTLAGRAAYRPNVASCAGITAAAGPLATAENVYQESMIHYHEDNQHADSRRAELHARLILDQKFFVLEESEKSINYFQQDLNSLTRALPTSTSRISKCQIDLLFSFLGTTIVANNVVQIIHSRRNSGNSVINPHQ